MNDKPKPRLAAIYVRTSSEHQAEKASPDEQEADCRKLATEQGINVINVYRDIEKFRIKGRLVEPSGTRSDRPGLLSLLKDAAAGYFDTILAWREDRLYRGMRAMLLVLDTIQEYKLNVLLARESFDPRMAPIKAWVAQMELEGMHERMTMGVKARLRNGKANSGQDRYGYRRNGEVIEIVEDEANWVRKIFEWYLSQVPLMEIHRRLIEAGAPLKGSTRPRRIPWAVTTIQSILKAAKEYSLGIKIQRREGEAFEIPAPAILNPEIYIRFIEFRKANAKHPVRHVRHDYLLSGILHCACGRKWACRTQASEWRKNSHGETIRRKTLSSSYACTQLHKEIIHEDCPRTIGHMKADEIVWKKVHDAVDKPDILMGATQKYVEEIRNQMLSVTDDQERLQKELDNLTMQRQWTITQARKGRISDEDLDYQLASLTLEELNIKREISSIIQISGLVNLDQWQEKAREYLEDLKIGIESLNTVPQTDEEQREQFELKRRIIKTLVERVDIKKDRDLKVTFRLDLLAILGHASGADQIRGVGTYTHTR